MNFPEILYKYRTWLNENHKNVLLKNELYLAKPSDFNDPFDCSIPTNYFALEDNEVENYISDAIKMHKPDLVDGEQIEMEKALLRERLSDRVNLQKDNDKLEIEHFNLHTGIVCFSERWNSVLKWSHYSDCHKGYCIGLNGLYISRLFGRGGKVDYNQAYPIIKPNALKINLTQQSFLKTHTKAEDWGYEEEYRLIKTNYPNALDRIINFPEECIAELILGIEMCENDKKEIIEIASKRNIRTYQAIKVPFKFEMNREQIL